MEQGNMSSVGAVSALLSTAEVGRLLRMSSKTVLRKPIKQVRLGPRTIRYRLEDVQDYIQSGDPQDE
jgi:predicted DNA-binding transcriptional regulator AlpA